MASLTICYCFKRFVFFNNMLLLGFVFFNNMLLLRFGLLISYIVFYSMGSFICRVKDDPSFSKPRCHTIWSHNSNSTVQCHHWTLLFALSHCYKLLNHQCHITVECHWTLNILACTVTALAIYCRATYKKGGDARCTS